MFFVGSHSVLEFKCDNSSELCAAAFLKKRILFKYVEKFGIPLLL